MNKIQEIIHINSYGDCKIDFHTNLLASIEVVFIWHRAFIGILESFKYPHTLRPVRHVYKYTFKFQFSPFLI